jgi:hypothetical protein
MVNSRIGAAIAWSRNHEGEGARGAHSPLYDRHRRPCSFVVTV